MLRLSHTGFCFVESQGGLSQPHLGHTPCSSDICASLPSLRLGFAIALEVSAKVSLQHCLSRKLIFPGTQPERKCSVAGALTGTWLGEPHALVASSAVAWDSWLPSIFITCLSMPVPNKALAVTMGGKTMEPGCLPRAALLGAGEP